MKDLELEKRFIELRSKGTSYRTISEELKVSRPTLAKWAMKHASLIENLKKIELEAFLEDMGALKKQRMEFLWNVVNELKSGVDFEDEDLTARGRLSLIPRFLRELSREATGIESEKSFQTEPDENQKEEPNSDPKSSDILDNL